MFLSLLVKVPSTYRKSSFQRAAYIHCVISFHLYSLQSAPSILNILDDNTDPFYLMGVIIASNHRTVTELDITPIVTWTSDASPCWSKDRRSEHGIVWLLRWKTIWHHRAVKRKGCLVEPQALESYRDATRQIDSEASGREFYS